MSELRKQLETARQDYQSARYPGSLADELLSTPRSTQKPTALPWVLAPLALAASVLLFVWFFQPTTVPNPTVSINTSVTTQPDVISTTQSSDGIVVSLSFPDDVAMAPSSDSEDISLVPSASELDIGSMPMMPSLDLSFSEPENAKEST